MVTKACTPYTQPSLPNNLPYYACAVNPYLAPATFSTCCHGPITNITTLSNLASDASCAAYCEVNNDQTNPVNPYGYSDFYVCLFQKPAWGQEINGFCSPPAGSTDPPSAFGGLGQNISSGYVPFSDMTNTYVSTTASGTRTSVSVAQTVSTTSNTGRGTSSTSPSSSTSVIATLLNSGTTVISTPTATKTASVAGSVRSSLGFGALVSILLCLTTILAV